MGLALDEPKESDKVFEENELTFLIEDGLMNRCGDIKVDFIEAGYRSGFSITSTNPVNKGAGGCSSGACSSGSCNV